MNTNCHNHQKKIALINDYSGFGRCSIAVALPIISMLKVQCCAVPTAILSNHTGFDSYFFDDYTDNMEAYIQEWDKLNLTFNGICSGFLGSKKQIKIVENFIKKFKTDNTIVLVDPVMGDYGKPYATYTTEMCSAMKELVHYADILTPNLTEACILTDTPYKEHWKQSELKTMTEKLFDMGPQKICITGIPQRSFVANYCYWSKKEPRIIRTHKIGDSRSGTGDVFAAILAADAVNGIEFIDSVKKASRFIKKCIECSTKLNIPLTDGVCFEELLYTLK